jgi:prepilin-type N-terminal cleavage/methylation domain-containing protein/prepilin-type processing-associated H-X9-DG protein
MKRGFTLTELNVVLAILLILAWVLLPVMSRSPEGAQRSSCQSNLKRMGLAQLQYLQDYDAQYPPITGSADGAFYGWADSYQPYLKNLAIYQCPAEVNTRSGSDPRAKGYTDYWMNARLSGIEAQDVRHRERTLIFGDGNDGTELTNARYAIATLPMRRYFIDSPPAHWLQRRGRPLYSHLEGANYAFADGHVKWLQPDMIKNQSSRQNLEPTFAVN